MKESIFSCLAIILLLGCSKPKSSFHDILEVSFEELSYGICTTDLSYKEYKESSPSGNNSVSTNFQLIKQTDKIPAVVGQKFGVQYRLVSKISRRIEVEHVWTFPKKMINEYGKEFKEIRSISTKSTNRTTFNTYILEEEFEVVKGKWTYQMFHQGKKLYERNFYLE